MHDLGGSSQRECPVRPIVSLANKIDKSLTRGKIKHACSSNVLVITLAYCLELIVSLVATVCAMVVSLVLEHGQHAGEREKGSPRRRVNIHLGCCRSLLVVFRLWMAAARHRHTLATRPPQVRPRKRTRIQGPRNCTRRCRGRGGRSIYTWSHGLRLVARYKKEVHGTSPGNARGDSIRVQPTPVGSV